MRQFWLGLLVGIVIGAAGATIYYELRAAGGGADREGARLMKGEERSALPRYSGRRANSL